MTAGTQGRERIDRRQILKGIYEENRRTVQNLPPPPKPKPAPASTSPWTPRTVGMAAVSMLVVLGFAYGTLQVGNPEGGAGRAVPVSAQESGTEVPTVLREGRARRGATPTIANLYGLQVRTIVLDAGHGGMDGGTVGQSGTKEKDITLDVARRLKERLERNYGYRVLLTRDADRKIRLRDRTAFANSNGADLFVSIHVNWIADSSATGLETYYFSSEGDARAMQTALRENEDSGYTVGQFNEMLADIGGTMKLQESRRLAESVQKSLYRNVSRINSHVSDWGVKRAPFVVLLGSQAPSILAEIACLNSPEEENKLNSSAYREKLAIFLEEGIINYLRQSPGAVETDGETDHAAAQQKEARR